MCANWDLIVKESEKDIDSLYTYTLDGTVYRFFGIVHGSDDYYYGMVNFKNELLLASCVGSLASNGFKKKKKT